MNLSVESPKEPDAPPPSPEPPKLNRKGNRRGTVEACLANLDKGRQRLKECNEMARIKNDKFKQLKETKIKEKIAKILLKKDKELNEVDEDYNDEIVNSVIHQHIHHKPKEIIITHRNEYPSAPIPIPTPTQEVPKPRIIFC
jgi:hypothetical protein